MAAVAGFAVFGLLMAVLVAAVIRFAVRLHRSSRGPDTAVRSRRRPSGETVERKTHT